MKRESKEKKRLSSTQFCARRQHSSLYTSGTIQTCALATLKFFLLFVNPWIMNVKILFIKKLTVDIYFWISCPVLTDVSGKEMTICICYASK